MNYVNVAINLAVKNLFKQFIYAVPEKFDYIDEGWRVAVPFGKKTVEGFVIGKKLSTKEAKEIFDLDKIKMIIEPLDERPWFDEKMIGLANWISQYYMASKAEAMRLFIPGKSGIKSGQNDSYEKKIKQKYENVYKITESGLDFLKTENKRLKAQTSALKAFQELGEIASVDLVKYKISNLTKNNLLKKDFICKFEKRVLRNSYDGVGESEKHHELSSEQAKALEKIEESLLKAENKTFLLQGVTGSGKTEVYLNAVKSCIYSGKQALVLVPEIALTGQTVRRFKAWFGEDIAVVHSKLSQNERADVWDRVRNNQAKVLIGVRSAVFVPFFDLGLIIVDEEHDYAYKQEERPSYNARVVAFVRAKLENAPLVLGSATPDISTYYNACKGTFEHLVLKNRPNNIELPEVEIVDMRNELAEGNKSVLSRKLKNEIKSTIEKDEQAIILLNRRGYSTFVMCRDCGESLMCPHCAVSLVYHRDEKKLRCHYCGNDYDIPDVCPKCNSRRIKFFGTGTQKAEDEISSMEENIKVLRMDQDSTVGKFSHEKILNKFRKKECNVLLGTQMVAKGHDIEDVSLVGVLSADAQLNLPDFRAGEKTFSLLTQAAGRAGRAHKRGKVILQVYNAENNIIALAAKQDYDEFAKQELELREALNYPPFSQLLKITIMDKNKNNALSLGEDIVKFISRALKNKESIATEILGPFPAIVEKTRDLYRINILIKGQKLSLIKKIILSSHIKDMKNVYFDVDPISVV